ncbi:transcription factor bHLH149-like [Mangifera indica]|uniref:transcription factor bHLH149-like n=1 Tax=Mangifera indica TaxID=29780 RepID=UPI001CF9A3A3|nr:transcription factor bHLH149-like [Mangifera indica]
MEPSPDSDDTSAVEPYPKRHRLNYYHHHSDHHHHFQSTNRWRTHTHQQIYSSKLLQAIRHVRRSNAGRSREFREIADRILAVSAKGMTRWSRAILATPLYSRLKKRHFKVKTGCSRLKRKAKELNKRPSRNSKLPAFEKKLSVLSRLIPGCRKISCLNLLGEATDYIAALEMQVRAMTALTEILADAPPVDNRIGSDLTL